MSNVAFWIMTHPDGRQVSVGVNGFSTVLVYRNGADLPAKGPSGVEVTWLAVCFGQVAQIVEGLRARSLLGALIHDGGEAQWRPSVELLQFEHPPAEAVAPSNEAQGGASATSYHLKRSEVVGSIPVLWVFAREGAPGQFLTPIDEATNRRFLAVFTNPMVAVEFAQAHPGAGSLLRGLLDDDVALVVEQSLGSFTHHAVVDWNGNGPPPIVPIRKLLECVGRPDDVDPVVLFVGLHGTQMPTFGPPDGSRKAMLVALPDGKRPAHDRGGKPLDWFPIRRSQVEDLVEGGMRRGVGYFLMPGSPDMRPISALMDYARP